MKYEIIGTDRRYYTKECYGQFDNLRDCLYHMESLNRTFGTMIKFKWREIEEEFEDDTTQPPANHTVQPYKSY